MFPLSLVRLLWCSRGAAAVRNFGNCRDLTMELNKCFPAVWLRESCAIFAQHSPLEVYNMQGISYRMKTVNCIWKDSLFCEIQCFKHFLSSYHYILLLYWDFDSLPVNGCLNSSTLKWGKRTCRPGNNRVLQVETYCLKESENHPVMYSDWQSH